MDSQLEIAQYRLDIFRSLLGNGVSPEKAIPLTERVYEAFYLGTAPSIKRTAKKR